MFQVSTSLFLVWLSSLAFVACEDPSTPSINLDIGVDEEMISSSDGAIDIDVSTPEEIESTCQSNRRPPWIFNPDIKRILDRSWH